jgi:Icc-related predicted phosphoesterase
MRNLILFFSLIFFFACSDKKNEQPPKSIKSVINNIVTKLYETKTQDELQNLTSEDVLKITTKDDLHILATKYWDFDVNVPVNVYLIRDVKQKVIPFWIEKAGFKKTDLSVKNEHYTYDVWKKEFPAGKVELGINGFDDHRPTYFVSVSAVNKTDKLKLSNFFPKGQYVETMDIGAFTYHDWTELIITELPEELKGGKVLPTIRGRAGESGMIGAFRKTIFPSSNKPDQILQTWSKDPKTTLSIQWRTNTDNKKGLARYWQKGSDKNKYKEAEAILNVMEDVLLANDRYINHFTARLEGLQAGTAYNYIVGNPETNIWSDTAEFKTDAAGNEAFSFIYLGDTHNSPKFGELINTAYKRFPEVAFYTQGGDLVSSGLNRDDWDKELGYSADVIKNRPFMAIPGNHDNANGLGPLTYAEIFDYPANGPENVPDEYSYSFEYGDALFLMLAATESIEGQTEWIENQLKNSKKTWKFAVFHFPPYSFDEDKYPEIIKEWGSLFDKYHVDIVFNGHVHYYLRTKPMYADKPINKASKGTIYVVSIAIPNASDRDLKEAEFSEVFVQGEMLYQKVDIDGNTLTLNTYNENDKIIDSFTITK